MKGLLVKDFKLFKLQSRFLLLIFAAAVFMIAAGQSAYFIISYSTIICGFFTISTISYDEFGNGYAFLFTMPFERKTYALEKYLFAILMAAAVLLFTTLASVIYTAVKTPGTGLAGIFLTSLMAMPVFLLMISFMLPLQLKFGPEKGRIANFLGMFLFFGLIGAVSSLQETLNLKSLSDRIAGLGLPVLTAAAVLLVLAILLISMAASVHIMKKKQF